MMRFKKLRNGLSMLPGRYSKQVAGHIFLSLITLLTSAGHISFFHLDQIFQQAA